MNLIVLLILGIIRGSEFDSWDVFVVNGSCYENQIFTCNSDAEEITVQQHSDANCTSEVSYTYSFIADGETCDSLIQVRFGCESDNIYYAECEASHEDSFSTTMDVCPEDFEVPSDIETCFEAMLWLGIDDFEVSSDETVPRCYIDDGAIYWAENGTDTHNEFVNETVCFCEGCATDSSSDDDVDIFPLDLCIEDGADFFFFECTNENLTALHSTENCTDGMSLVESVVADGETCTDGGKFLCLDDYAVSWGCDEEYPFSDGEYSSSDEENTSSDEENTSSDDETDSASSSVTETVDWWDLTDFTFTSSFEGDVTDFAITFSVYGGSDCNEANFMDDYVHYINVDVCEQHGEYSEYIRCEDDLITIETYTTTDCTGSYSEDTLHNHGDCTNDIHTNDEDISYSESWDFDCPAEVSADWYTGEWSECAATTECVDGDVSVDGTYTRDVSCYIDGTTTEAAWSYCHGDTPLSEDTCIYACPNTVEVTFELELSGTCADVETEEDSIIASLAEMMSVSIDVIIIESCTDSARRLLSTTATIDVTVLTADAEAAEAIVSIVESETFVEDLNTEMVEQGVTTITVTAIAAIEILAAGCVENADCTSFNTSYCYDVSFRETGVWSEDMEGSCSAEEDDCCELGDIVTQDTADCPQECSILAAGGGAGAAIAVVFVMLILGIVGSYFLRKKYYPTNYEHEKENDGSWEWWFQHQWHGIYVCPFNTYMAMRLASSEVSCPGCAKSTENDGSWAWWFQHQWHSCPGCAKSTEENANQESQL